MATKPTDPVPRWADTVSSDTTRVSEPVSGKKDVGFETGEKPAAQFINWFFLRAYEWLGWAEDSIDDLEAGAHVAERVKMIHASAGQADPADWLVGADYAESVATNSYVAFPVALNVGDRIKRVDVYVRATTGASVIDAKVWSVAPLAPGSGAAALLTPTQVGSTASGTADNTHQTLSITGLTHTITATGYVYVSVFSGTGSTKYVYGVKVTYDHPA
jgi:hypothetical protein